jgi:ammonium transporter, Amt family
LPSISLSDTTHKKYELDSPDPCLYRSADPCFADEPKPDPSGIATGDKTTAVDAAGNSFVVPEPTDKTRPITPPTRRPSTTTRPRRQRTAGHKLADSVGHVRVATNFAWTLNTGYLVLFMQAGFALLTCGLVRKKNAAHLMMLNFAAYVFAFLAYYAVGYAFQFGAVAINAAPVNLGGIPTLNHFLIGSGQWGFVGGKGFFLSVGPAYDSASNCLTLFEVVFMETAGYIIVGASASASPSGRSCSANFSSARFSIPSPAAGPGAAAGSRRSALR